MYTSKRLWCLVMVGRLFLAVPWGCLRFVIVVFPDHTHLLFLVRLNTHISHYALTHMCVTKIVLIQGKSPYMEIVLTLKAPRKNASENVVCWSHLLQIIAWHYWRIKYRSKQRGPRTDCSYRSSLIWVHTVCHGGFLSISADEKSKRLLLRFAH